MVPNRYDSRHIWSLSKLKLQAYLVPIITKIASIIGPPYINRDRWTPEICDGGHRHWADKPQKGVSIDLWVKPISLSTVQFGPHFRGAFKIYK